MSELKRLTFKAINVRKRFSPMCPAFFTSLKGLKPSLDFRFRIKKNLTNDQGFSNLAEAVSV
ncbi:hypothetical protein AMD27_11345 [Acinetobacter sp. TGL-Y2]|uniref:hypothetical protein n=1 Tax=Acinetobacter sp. TGL-Y2 TaxID=1407071 RepID=UPI0007A653C6|nr:hypothetical protein [Acinetobacter sp. TGL-Y2]AMW79425.1 hypothetical protein AMD27_11345 [Acinetobacter sp. TGL-Y2]